VFVFNKLVMIDDCKIQVTFVYFWCCEFDPLHCFSSLQQDLRNAKSQFEQARFNLVSFPWIQLSFHLKIIHF
jgi:hypothetical protein